MKGITMNIKFETKIEDEKEVLCAISCDKKGIPNGPERVFRLINEQKALAPTSQFSVRPANPNLSQPGYFIVTGLEEKSVPAHYYLWKKRNRKKGNKKGYEIIFNENGGIHELIPWTDNNVIEGNRYTFDSSKKTITPYRANLPHGVEKVYAKIDGKYRLINETTYDNGRKNFNGFTKDYVNNVASYFKDGRLIKKIIFGPDEYIEARYTDSRIIRIHRNREGNVLQCVVKNRNDNMTVIGQYQDNALANLTVYNDSYEEYIPPVNQQAKSNLLQEEVLNSIRRDENLSNENKEIVIGLLSGKHSLPWVCKQKNVKCREKVSMERAA